MRVSRGSASLCLHRLGVHCRADGSRQACLWRHYQHRRVGEVKCWLRLLLPQPARVYRRLSRGEGATSQQYRAWAAWAFASEHLAVRRPVCPELASRVGATIIADCWRVAEQRYFAAMLEDATFWIAIAVTIAGGHSTMLLNVCFGSLFGLKSDIS
jgi:hypothetical protein